MEPQTKKPVSVPDNPDISFRVETSNGRLLMIMDNLALRIKKGLPPSPPCPDTEIKVFTVEGFIQGQEATKLEKLLFPASHGSTGGIKAFYRTVRVAQVLDLLQIPFAPSHLTSHNFHQIPGNHMRLA